jgi:hypothetical protein
MVNEVEWSEERTTHDILSARTHAVQKLIATWQVLLETVLLSHVLPVHMHEASGVGAI